jgi:tetratricopeptide (TPR) repeat protein
VSQYPDTKVTETMSELESLNLIEPLASGPRGLYYHFIHEKIREVLIEGINPLQRRQLHERTASALEGMAKGHISEHAAILAHHYQLGGNPRQAIHYWIEAGRYARQLYSSAEALQAFSAASKLIQFAPSLTEEEIHSLYDDWTELAYVIEDADTIKRINDELFQLGKRYESHLLIGAALDGQSDACMVANEFERGLDLVNQAIAHLEQTDNLYEQMQAYNNRGVFLYMLNQVEEAIYSFQDALALGVGSSDNQVIRARANAHFQIAVARTLNGWPKISYSHALRSLEDYCKVNQLHGQVTAYSALALARYFLGNYSQARVDCQNGIQLAERLQAWRMLGYLHAYRAMVEAASANVDTAFEHATLAIGLGERYRHNEITATGYTVLGDLYSWLESHDLAVESYRRGIDASKNGFLAVNPMFRLGHSLCRTGSIEAGLKLQHEAAEIAQRTGLGLIHLFTQLSEVIVSLMLGQIDRTKIEGVKVLKMTSERAIPSVEIYSNIALGQAAVVEEDLETAEKYFLNAASKGAQLPLPWGEIEALRQLENVQRLSGRPDPAPRERIRVLLDQIATTAGREPLLEIFHNYRINKMEFD